MKTTLSLVAAACLLAACTGQPQRGYVIESSSPQYVDGQYMYLVNVNTVQPLDSARIENSSFRLESQNKGPGIGMLYMGASSDPAELMQMSGYIFLEDGEMTTQWDSISDLLNTTGTPQNDAYYELLQLTRSGAPAEQIKTRQLELIGQHNVLSCYLLNNLRLNCTKAEIESLMAGFPADMKQHPLFLQVKAQIDAIQADLGMPYLDISAKNTSDKDALLSDVVKQPGCRYVLLEFWATWCGACVQEIPNLKTLYKQYKDKGFDIYGVSFTHSRDYWKKFVAEKGMDWTNVQPDFEGNARFTCPLWAAYGLDGIPWNFLIDASTGQIIAKNLQGEKLKEKLAELLD